MTRSFTSADEGKRVVTPGGDVVGAVARVDPNAVYVRPREELLRGCGSWLAGPWEGTELFELDCETVVRVTDREVVILPTALAMPEVEARPPEP